MASKDKANPGQPREQLRFIRQMNPGEAWVIQHGEYSCVNKKRIGSQATSYGCSLARMINRENNKQGVYYMTTHMPTGDLGVAYFDLKNPVEI